MDSQGSITKYESKLVGKRIIILGGTSGMGFAVAQAALQSGAIVTVSSSSQAKIEKALERLRRDDLMNTSQLRGYCCDLFSLSELEDNVRKLFESATENGKYRTDHVVYTAGNKVGSIPLADIDTKMITEHGILRFYAPIIIGKVASTYMNASPTSSITFTSGINNLKPVPGRVLMAGWGAGVEGVTRALAVDLKPIRVNCVCPGPTRTELFAGFPTEVLTPLLKKYESATMTNTIGTPEDLAEAYLYCMKDRFVDGTVINSSGGYLLA